MFLNEGEYYASARDWTSSPYYDSFDAPLISNVLNLSFLPTISNESISQSAKMVRDCSDSSYHSKGSWEYFCY